MADTMNDLQNNDTRIEADCLVIKLSEKEIKNCYSICFKCKKQEINYIYNIDRDHITKELNIRSFSYPIGWTQIPFDNHHSLNCKTITLCTDCLSLFIEKYNDLIKHLK